MNIRLVHLAALLLVPIVAAAPAQVERLPQADGGVPGDASNDCALPGPELIADVATLGRLDPPTDAADHYAFRVDASAVGRPHVALMLGLPPEPYALRVHAPFPDGQPCAVPLARAEAGAPLEFVPHRAGTYVVEAFHVGAGLPDAAHEALHALPSLGPSTSACHNMCEQTLVLAGYAIVIKLPS